KNLPEGEKLYTGAKVNLETGSSMPSRSKKVLRSDLQAMTRPKPNTRLLGIPVKLAIYNTFAKAKPKSIFGKLRDKMGEPPVLLSSVDLTRNSKVIQSHLENKGFFRTALESDTIVKGKKAHATYDVNAGEQYTIKSIEYVSDSTNELEVAIQQTVKESLIKPGDPYDLDVIKGERIRIDGYLKEKGFYFFSPEHLLVKIDSTAGTNQVDMRVAVKPEAPGNAQQAYRINNVFIYSGYNLNTANLDTNKANREFYQGYNIIDRRKRYKPKLFKQIMMFEPGEVYNRTDHNLTLNRLINLNQFKYVKNRFEELPDSAKLDAYYYLTPLPRQSLRGEVNATTKSNNLNGTQFNLSWSNRNRFRAGEQISLSAYVGSEIAFGGAFKGYNTYRTGAELNLTIPRFVAPFLNNLNTRGGFVPRTNMQIGYDLLNRRKLYTLNSYRGGLGYLWKESTQKQHEFYPISINYVQPLNVTDSFKVSALKYPYLNRIVDSQFILGSTYQYTLNQLATGLQKINAFFFNGLVDVSGNVAGLLTGANASNSEPKRIMKAVFDQYIKLEADGRYYRRIGLKSSWANRIIVGYGLPYGNSDQLPYIKQFFIGGNNSIRAFRSRTIGPGSYPLLATSTSFPDQTGDIKLEINTEFRPHISGPLYGAVFLDAGNIWLKNEDPSRPGASFSKDFIKELAIGTGAGIRLDITMFVIRLDLGIPIRKPWVENPWLLNQIRLGQKEWRRENIVYNLAIGYHF
ncbi:MAG TPA: BamA/TamA family outer membrane protein, partial [Chitinophagaceae bacterium]|nr:BamA/TamA family outer membrane protein [Chitinophagaceae bacterium]